MSDDLLDRMRVTWRSVGRIITRVVAEGLAREDVLEGLVRIGIDEVSHRKGHKYLTVVYDHDRKRVVWVAAGRDSQTMARVFDELGPERYAKLHLTIGDRVFVFPERVRVFVQDVQI